MSGSSKVNNSPRHFMVLHAISKGIDTEEKIAIVVKKSMDEVRRIINDLVNQRLASTREKGWFFGTKETKLTITETGRSLISGKLQELRISEGKLKQMYDGRDKQQLQTYMDSNRMWIPFMLISGIIDALFYVSILSFVGLAMNPSEQAIVDSGGNEGADSDDDATEDDNDSNSGSADTSSTDNTVGGDMDSHGFDGVGSDF